MRFIQRMRRSAANTVSMTSEPPRAAMAAAHCRIRRLRWQFSATGIATRNPDPTPGAYDDVN